MINPRPSAKSLEKSKLVVENDIGSTHHFLVQANDILWFVFSED